jgi:nucleotide-binding universal stress UspA family protein
MNILLAVDGSDYSYEAGRALKFFRRPDAITLLHVMDVPKPAYRTVVPEVAEEFYRTVEERMKEDGQRVLERAQALLPAGLGSITKRLEVGSPANVIVTEAEQRKVDLILMGSRGMSPAKERLFGSVSHRVLTHASAATCILNGPLNALKHILVPLQGPYDTEAAVRFFAMQPFRDAVELTLFTVFAPTSVLWPADAMTAASMEKHAVESALDFLEPIATQLRNLGYTTQTLAAGGSPATTILAQAAKIKADLIVMGTHGRKGITRFVLGSVSHALLHSASYPVLVYH